MPTSRGGGWLGPGRAVFLEENHSCSTNPAPQGGWGLAQPPALLESPFSGLSGGLGKLWADTPHRGGGEGQPAHLENLAPLARVFVSGPPAPQGR